MGLSEVQVHQEKVANADLIAQAPHLKAVNEALLEALKACLNLEFGFGDKARAALALAEAKS